MGAMTLDTALQREIPSSLAHTTSDTTHARGAAPRLRLTRRGRIVVGTLLTMLVSALLAAAAVLGSSQAVASADTAGEQEFGYVVVAPGASLWEVATALDGSTDPRDLVAEIVRLNQLEGSGVEAGQPIAVPLRYAEADGVIPASELGL